LPFPVVPLLDCYDDYNHHHHHNVLERILMLNMHSWLFCLLVGVFDGVVEEEEDGKKNGIEIDLREKKQ
jgi:hypothetical protein